MSVDLLPNEAGGKAGSIVQMQEAGIKEIDDKREWFLEEMKCGKVDESLRIGKSNIANDLFGVDGTFKKLDIDWESICSIFFLFSEQSPSHDFVKKFLSLNLSSKKITCYVYFLKINKGLLSCTRSVFFFLIFHVCNNFID